MLRPEIFFPLLAAVGLWGCQQQQLPSTTSGKVRVECDESVFPVLKLLKEDFERTYKDASVDIRSAEARSAIADFIDDSVRVIVCARSFNAEERAVIKAAGIEYQEYKIALDAVAVIGHRDNALKQLRVGQLDSIFSGSVTRWPGKPKSTIEIAVGGANTSINEVFRNVILKGRPFSPSAIPFPSSENLVTYVSASPNAIGIVGVNWLQGRDKEVTVFALGSPNERPDSTQPFGQYYSPAQANVYRRYYPISREVYAITREVRRDLGLGFISYISSAPGQKVFLNNGLVPVTMPVRLVQLTSDQVK